MVSFVQDVFNEISLERDPELWQSTDDRKNLHRIHFLSEFEETCFRQQLESCYSPALAKNSKLSQAFRLKADKVENQTEKLTLLNKAADFATDAEFASILRTRAQVLSRLKKHSLVVADVDYLKESFQTSGDIELEYLKHQSLSQILHQGKKPLQTQQADKLFADKKVHDLEKLNHDLTQQVAKNESRAGLPFTETNKEHPSFAAFVGVERTQRQGRFTVALRDIQPGEVLAIDRPTIKFLDKDHIKTNCWHCLRNCRWNPYPCSSCSGVIFCSLGCKTQSQSSYHFYECGRTDLLYKSSIEVWILALRMVASKPVNFFVDNSVDDVIASAASSDNEVDGLRRTIMMESHPGSPRFSAPELMKEALVAVFITRYLTSSQYFGKREEDTTAAGFDDRQMRVAAWLHHLMRVARFNSHEVTQKQDDHRTKRIGVATNPQLALINHSCDPNYGRVWIDGTKQVVAFATRPIAKGEEICDAYSGIFSYADANERSGVHQRYFFDCVCQPCREEWPRIHQLPTKVKGLPKSAYYDQENAKRLHALVKNKDNLKAKPSKKKELLTETIECMKLAEKVLVRPHALLCFLEEEVHTCLILEYGV